MKTELLIIVAIILLCSWCVYILVKMNGSVESSYQASSKVQLTTINRATEPDFGSETSKSVHHGASLDPPYRLYSNITENPYSNYSYVYPEISPHDLEDKNNSTNSEEYEYEEEDPTSLDRNTQMDSNNKTNNYVPIADMREDHDYHQLDHLPLQPTQSNNMDIDVTRPKDNYRRSKLSSNHYQRKDVSKKKRPPVSEVGNGLRSSYLQTPLEEDEYIGDQASSSNQPKSYSKSTKMWSKLNDNNRDQMNDDPKDGDDSGVEVDHRSGATSYDEQENEAHDNGHNYTSSSPQSDNYSSDNRTPKRDRTRIVKSATKRSNQNNAKNSGVQSDEYEYYDDDDVDPATAATNEVKNHPLDKDTHEHKLKESVVSQKWDDDLVNDDDRSNITTKSIKGSKNTEGENHDDDDSIRFLDLDKKRTTFSSKRFRRFISSHNDIENHVVSDNTSNLEASGNSLYGSAIKVQLPDLSANNLSLSATLNPYESAQISLDPGGTVLQYPEFIDNRYKKNVRRGKRRYRKSSPDHQIEIVPVENYQTGINPEYIVVDKDRASQPSRRHSKKKKHKGHKSNKSISKGKHSKMHTSKKNKLSKSYKKGKEKKRKHNIYKDKYKIKKGFQGMKKGEKHQKGHGNQGGKKGLKKYKDKGFKKKGFRNTYHKEEWGNRKTYFNEYRDKDFKKKYKKFDDKYKYDNMKKWSGKDLRRMKKLKDMGKKHHKSGKAGWKKKHSGKHKKVNEYHGHGSHKKKKSSSKKH